MTHAKHPQGGRVVELAVEDLPSSAAEAARAHVAACVACRGDGAAYAGSMAILRDSAPPLDPERSLAILTSVLAQARAEGLTEPRSQTSGLRRLAEWLGVTAGASRRRLIGAAVGAAVAVGAVLVMVLAPRHAAIDMTPFVLAREGSAAVGSWSMDASREMRTPSGGAVTARLASGLVVRWHPETTGGLLTERDGVWVLPLTAGAIDVRYDRPAEGRPLVITTPGGEVRVTGTVLHVAWEAAELSVLVTRGKVTVAQSGILRPLQAGESVGSTWSRRQPVDPIALDDDRTLDHREPRSQSAAAPQRAQPLALGTHEDRGELVLTGAARNVRVGDRALALLPAVLRLPVGGVTIQAELLDGEEVASRIAILPEQVTRVELESLHAARRPAAMAAMTQDKGRADPTTPALLEAQPAPQGTPRAASSAMSATSPASLPPDGAVAASGISTPTSSAPAAGAASAPAPAPAPTALRATPQAGPGADAAGDAAAAAGRDAAAPAAGAATSPEALALYREVEAALARGDRRAAIELLRRVIIADPTGDNGVLAQFELGRLLLAEGDADGAALAWREALRAGLREPLAGRARLGLCRIAVEAADDAQARACLDGLAAASGATAAEASLLWGRLECAAAAYEKAERAFVRAVELASGADLSLRIEIARTKCALARGDLAWAAAAYARLEAKGAATRYAADLRDIENGMMRARSRLLQKGSQNDPAPATNP